MKCATSCDRLLVFEAIAIRHQHPGASFESEFPEDETRVRWLRPDEELTVLEPMPSPFREIAKSPP